MKWIKRWYHKLFTEHTALQGYVAHFPHGAVTVLLVDVHWILSLLFGGGFLIFQLNQEHDGYPAAHYDLAGWLLGLAVCGVIKVLI